MKKRILCAAALCVAVMLGGCASNDSGTEYVKLGEYKGLEVQVETPVVTDEEVNAQIERLLSDKSTTEEVTGRPVADGDVVNIDYEGLVDGEAFDGGSAEGYDLTIGSGRFIDGFEEGLIGAEIGDQVSLNLTFPDPYDNNPDLAGKPVVFNVTVNSIQETVTPELTDEFVQTLGDEYQTVEDYTTALKNSLLEQKQQSIDSQTISDLQDMLLENCEILQYPEGAVDDYVAEMTDYYNEYAAAYSMTLDEFMQQNYGMTEDEFNEEAQTMAEQNVGLELIYQAIAEAEGISISDEEYAELCTQYTSDFGFETEEEFVEYYGGEEEVRANMLADKVLEFVADNAVEVTA